jgi:LysM repeat protein
VAPQVQDISPARAELERRLASPLQFQAYDPIRNETHTYSLSREAMLQVLSLSVAGESLEIGLDLAAVQAHLSAWGETFAPGRQLDLGGARPDLADPHLAQALLAGEPLRLRHLPTTYIVQSGDTLLRIAWQVGLPYWKLLEANPGLNAEALQPGQSIQVPSVDEMLPLPVVENKRLVISISRQRMWAYQDGALLWDMVISTGIDRSPTQPGVFQVQSHSLNAYAAAWDLNMPHFIGIYEAWPGFMNGIHGLPTLANGQRLWANILGRPASYGCIILGLADAERVYHWAEPGVVVEIQP